MTEAPTLDPADADPAARRETPRSRTRWRLELGWLVAAVVGALLAAVLVLRLWRAHAHVPFYACAKPVGHNGSGCDAVFYAGVVKTVLHRGWYFDQPHLGFPTGLNLRDFPNVDPWHIFFLDAFSLVSRDWALAMNALYVGSFALIAATAYLALRGLGVRAPVAAGGAIITAFLPYHLVRNESHLLWTDYAVAPLVVMLSVRQISNRPWFRIRGEGPSSRSRTVAAIAIAVFAGGALAYYTVMSAALLLLPALFVSVLRRKLEPALSSLVLVAILAVAFGAQLAPTFLNDAHHGKNHAFDRPLTDQDAFSLRPLLVVTPRDEHRVPLLGHVADRYATLPSSSERGQSAGLFGAAGLVGLLALALAPVAGRRGLRHPYDRGLALVGVTALLLGVTAGGGELLAMAGLTEIRAWNRISVFVGFVGIAAAARFVDWFLAHRRAATRVVVVVVAVVTALAVLDQTSGADTPQYAATAKEFAVEDHFVHAIEQTFGKDSAVLQLPYTSFPEFGTLFRMRDYSHLRGWLHSDTLRWSYGAIKGRPSWQDGQRRLPVPAQLRRARAAGFTVVWVDRRGFADHGRRIELLLKACLGSPPLVESDGNRAVYDLRADPRC